MRGRDDAVVLHDRIQEREALDTLVSTTRAGESQVLTLCGEAGVGKTALLDDLAGRIAGCRLIRAAGAESEMELAFAGLHQLCAPLLDRLDHLPGPQRDALATAFGLRAGDPPDRFLVGLAVLSLLSTAAADEPLICLIDDAQWLDRVSAQTLAFVARRLLAERVALVFAVRDPAGTPELAGLPELAVGGLDESNARALLESALATRLDEQVRDRIIAETRGNPLALLELPQGLPAANLAGGFALPDTAPLTSRIEQSFLQRMQALPAPTRQLLLTAAAEPLGDVPLLLRAAQQLRIGLGAAGAAEAAGLIEIDSGVRFRHPLVRSAIYRAAGAEQRRAVHRALAAATDPDVDPDRRAWHRAHATDGPDESVAAELEGCAGRAQTRGGLAAAAAFLERAAQLTPEPARRRARTLAAAQATLEAGSEGAATALLATVESGPPLSEWESATAHLLRGQIAFVSNHGRDAPRLLVESARRFGPIDPTLARDTYLDALAAGLFVGRFGGDVSLRDVALAARTATPVAAGPPDLLRDALAETITNGYATGAPRLRRAVAAFSTEPMPSAQAIRWLWLATHAAHDLWDEHSWQALSDEHIRLARQVGALHILPLALSARVGLHLFAGEFGAAASLIAEIAAVTAATGSELPRYGPLELAAYQGREGRAGALINAALAEVHSRGEGMGLSLIQHAQSVLYNGLGQYDKALAAAQDAVAHGAELAFANWSLVELVEAATRAGRREQAADATARLSSITGPCGTEWALGVQARCRALVSDGEQADPLYREAIGHLARTAVPLELGRAHLLYGEWLRHNRRRADAREQLRLAHTIFDRSGAEAFAERTRRELQATGETIRKPALRVRVELTAQEERIARLARGGLTNPEIGAQLFLSPHTVEWHLRKVFTKLGISSRRQLHGTLAEAAIATEPA